MAKPAAASYRLGLPLWGDRAWAGSLYSKDAKPADYLEQYARVFDAVEGNTTFYSMPAEPTVQRWREQTPESFRFTFKLPRTITHDLALARCERETALFLRLMEPLGPRLGPFMIQLPAAFGPEHIPVLERFLRWLPDEFQYAVELRHTSLYEPEAIAHIDRLLGEHRADRIIMDTRALRSGDRTHPDVVAADHKKPDLPFVDSRTGRHGFVRMICHPDHETNGPWIVEIARLALRWMEQGTVPYVFIHCANNAKAPPIARRFHEVLAGLAVDAGVTVGEHPVWAGDVHETAAGQLSML